MIVFTFGSKARAEKWSDKLAAKSGQIGGEII